jgi:hypothetical protein
LVTLLLAPDINFFSKLHVLGSQVVEGTISFVELILKHFDVVHVFSHLGG